MPVPENPKIYHITHVDNLANIAQAGCLWSDAKRLTDGIECEVVGMSGIKQRRLKELEVDCHPGTTVGEFVPFYLCPRSVMLYILHKGNHPELAYRDGQGPIVHLVGDLRNTVAWADGARRPWAFTKCNAGTRYAGFFCNAGDLPEIDWAAVESTDFRDPDIKEGKQAEFLVYESFPWESIEEIGVRDTAIRDRAEQALRGANHRPPVRIRPNWYY